MSSSLMVKPLAFSTAAVRLSIGTQFFCIALSYLYAIAYSASHVAVSLRRRAMSIAAERLHHSDHGHPIAETVLRAR
jgi:hypothetical protein